MPQPLYPRELVFFGLTLDSSIRCALSVALFVRAPVVMCVTLICCSSHVPISPRILRKIKQYNDTLLGPRVRCLFRDVCSMGMYRFTPVCSAADAVRGHDSFSTVLPDCKFTCHIAEAPAVSVFE